MSSKTKFFRNFRKQLKNILSLKKNHLVYQAFASEEQFQIACKANDELQFRRQCMARTALKMRKARRQGCRAKYRWNQQMVRKVAHTCYDIPSCWGENGEYVYSPHMKGIFGRLSLIDLREKQEDIVEVTCWTKCHKDSEEGFSATFPPLQTVPTKRTKSSVSALFYRVVPCVKLPSRSVTESSSSDTESASSASASSSAASCEMMLDPDIQSPDIGSESDVQCPEAKMKPVVRYPVRTPMQLQLESLVIMSHFLKERPELRRRRINVEEWSENYCEKLRQHYNKLF